MAAEFAHRSVLVQEALRGLNINPAGRYVDGTFGRGGHAGEILKRLSAEGRLLVIDKDPEAIAHGRVHFGDDSRITFRQGSFADLKSAAEQLGWQHAVDGVLLDLGVSSPQLDNAARGFSFLNDGPLDMRMDNASGESAAAWLAGAEGAEIARVLKEYGEERFAKRIAAAIVSARDQAPLRTTAALAQLIADAVPVREKHKHPATRSFQAIRIHLNRELEDLSRCLPQAVALLAPAGRLVVISFHSLEDRIVKRFMRDAARGDRFPPGVPVTQAQLQPELKRIGGASRPTAEEIASNPRARSAVLRVAERLA
ncbi:MAG: 16S rRNA (cytosine(1402)-N(4))-methyltransferase RsmH [Gammaproteobacteria bacterium]|nr:16S rRNA (cytosine(1402)-N(4))-methyltransferase RsmH [Gammaproteobacteria bacterium]